MYGFGQPYRLSFQLALRAAEHAPSRTVSCATVTTCQAVACVHCDHMPFCTNTVTTCQAVACVHVVQLLAMLPSSKGAQHCSRHHMSMHYKGHVQTWRHTVRLYVRMRVGESMCSCVCVVCVLCVVCVHSLCGIFSYSYFRKPVGWGRIMAKCYSTSTSIQLLQLAHKAASSLPAHYAKLLPHYAKLLPRAVWGTKSSKTEQVVLSVVLTLCVLLLSLLAAHGPHVHINRVGGVSCTEKPVRTNRTLNAISCQWGLGMNELCTNSNVQQKNATWHLFLVRRHHLHSRVVGPSRWVRACEESDKSALVGNDVCPLVFATATHAQRNVGWSWASAASSSKLSFMRSALRWIIVLSGTACGWPLFNSKGASKPMQNKGP